MHNHSYIWQNMTMIIFLMIVLLFFLILHSKMKFEFYFSSLNFEYNYTISIIYFKKLKTFYKKDVEMWIKKRRKKFGNKYNQKGRGKKYLNYINKFIKYFEFEKLKVYAKSGLIATLPTVFAVPIISSILSMIYSRYKINYSKDCYFEVEPAYEELNLTSKIHCIISTSIVNIIYIIISLLMERRKKNGRTSNRRVNEYCYE